MTCRKNWTIAADFYVDAFFMWNDKQFQQINFDPLSFALKQHLVWYMDKSAPFFQLLPFC